MNIEKVSYSTTYPYVIEGSWGQKMDCSREDLVALKKEIDRVLNESRPPVRVPSQGSIGGQMVRRMIEAYEGKRNG